MHGLRLELQHPSTVEVLSFSGSGMVAATVGERHGYLAGPAYSWRLHGEWLEIGSADAGFSQRMRAVSVTKRTIVVEDGSGRRSVYAYRNEA